ncbi:hypothetical protein CAS74_002760 [Pichia kudriavzevii]|uniref:Major facilitator superfamily (MFS) profile domain-containing protein n=1 Tax=Pichia kudriavzevii TaxID=4909 RepID=A0A1Z8JMX3_PICKU|nr:hypothetical protein CAS74_002760 [Pichia kudriavzevii]
MNVHLLQQQQQQQHDETTEIAPGDIPGSILVGRPLLVFMSVFVSICVFLFGYDQGYFSSIIVNPHFKLEFNDPSALQIGTVVAILEIGALLTSLSLTHIAERRGRRRTTRLGALLFSLGGLVQTFAWNLTILGLGRFVSGMGVGLLSGTAPMYMIEISGADQRGFLGCVQFTGNILGYSSSIWLDYACSYIDGNLSFRIPLASQVFFGLILWLGSYLLVESPRWLLEHDHDEEGLVVLADLFANGEVHSPIAIQEFSSIKENVILNLITYPHRVFIACSAQFFAQFNGINVISYYAPLVFENAGWEGRDALKMTGLNSIIYLISTLIPWKLSESWGRKPLLIFGGAGMGISLILISIILYSNTQNWWFCLSQFITPFLPNKARSGGSSLATATNWISNFIVGQLAPILLEKIQWRLYLIHSISCFTSMCVVYFVYPETKGLSLEEMESLFNDGTSSMTKSSRAPSTVESATLGIDPMQPPQEPNINVQYQSWVA